MREGEEGTRKMGKVGNGDDGNMAFMNDTQAYFVTCSLELFANTDTQIQYLHLIKSRGLPHSCSSKHQLRPGTVEDDKPLPPPSRKPSLQLIRSPSLSQIQPTL